MCEPGNTVNAEVKGSGAAVESAKLHQCHDLRCRAVDCPLRDGERARPAGLGFRTQGCCDD